LFAQRNEPKKGTPRHASLFLSFASHERAAVKLAALRQVTAESTPIAVTHERGCLTGGRRAIEQ
jgi:hypothetical protein